jgi:hypothetical protein
MTLCLNAALICLKLKLIGGGWKNNLQFCIAQMQSLWPMQVNGFADSSSASG